MGIAVRTSEIVASLRAVISALSSDRSEECRLNIQPLSDRQGVVGTNEAAARLITKVECISSKRKV